MYLQVLTKIKKKLVFIEKVIQCSLTVYTQEKRIFTKSTNIMYTILEKLNNIEIKFLTGREKRVKIKSLIKRRESFKYK